MIKKIIENRKKKKANRAAIDLKPSDKVYSRHEPKKLFSEKKTGKNISGMHK